MVDQLARDLLEDRLVDVGHAEEARCRSRWQKPLTFSLLGQFSCLLLQGYRWEELLVEAVQLLDCVAVRVVKVREDVLLRTKVLLLLLVRLLQWKCVVLLDSDLQLARVRQFVEGVGD